MPWPAIVFGWPAVIGAVIGFAVAFWSRRAGPALVAALMAAPFCLVASGYPLLLLRVGGLAALFANFGAVWFLYRRQRLAAAAMLLPFAIVAARIAVPLLT